MLGGLAAPTEPETCQRPDPSSIGEEFECFLPYLDMELGCYGPRQASRPPHARWIRLEAIRVVVQRKIHPKYSSSTGWSWRGNGFAYGGALTRTLRSDVRGQARHLVLPRAGRHELNLFRLPVSAWVELYQPWIPQDYILVGDVSHSMNETSTKSLSSKPTVSRQRRAFRTGVIDPSNFSAVTLRNFDEIKSHNVLLCSAVDQHPKGFTIHGSVEAKKVMRGLSIETIFSCVLSSTSSSASPSSITRRKEIGFFRKEVEPYCG
ncbi:hypothetical protein ON010_g6158 [Phytophthora cinnamomi]|nr:hypothetical protein ON010_g6158 [Phytophthora cinnamomi]